MTTASPAMRAKTPDRAGLRLRLRRVLVPVDFSPLSVAAVAAARPLLQEFGAQLHLVYVAPPDYPLPSLAAVPELTPEVEIETRTRARLQALGRKYAIALAREHIHMRKGRPFEEICRLARKLGVDLIVTSTHGWTGLKHLLIGSTAERVVRHAPCPVLVVHPKNKAAPLEFKKILVPLDFSALSLQGLSYARALAWQFRAQLTLLHSVDLRFMTTNEEYVRYDFPEFQRAAEYTAYEQINELVRAMDWKGLTVESALETGHPGDRICRSAESLGADLIITSTHGRTGLEHLLLGSTAEYVVRHARCPVLVVPSHERTPLPPREKEP